MRSCFFFLNKQITNTTPLYIYKYVFPLPLFLTHTHTKAVTLTQSSILMLYLNIRVKSDPSLEKKKKLQNINHNEGYSWCPQACLCFNANRFGISSCTAWWCMLASTSGYSSTFTCMRKEACRWRKPCRNIIMKLCHQSHEVSNVLLASSSIWNLEISWRLLRKGCQRGLLEEKLTFSYSLWFCTGHHIWIL